jgi:uncharacterized SAM-binding protein YcdF (DUF218 family)
MEKLNSTPSTPESTLEKAAQVFYEYLKMEDAPEPADAIFLLGGSTLGPTKKASELYKAGYAPNIAFLAIGGTYGGDKEWGMPEFEKYREVLKHDGIPDDAVLSEGKGTNTLNEVQAAIPFLKEHGVDPQKVILVSRPIHQRRAYATFREQYPEVTYINCPANEPLDVNDADTRQRLVAEAERLLDYSKKGDIEKQEIPFAVLRAAATIRVELKNEGTYTDRRKPKQ